jgi:hypothetical protein
VLALQRTAGNQATARFLQRQPTAGPTPDVDNRANDLAWEQIYPWFDALAGEVRQREAGSPVQSTAELVYMACELEYTDPDGKRAKVRDHVKPSAIESYIKARAKQQASRCSTTATRRRPRPAGRGDRDPRQPRPPPDRAHLRQRQREHHDLDRRQAERQRRRAAPRGETLPEGGAKGSAKIKGKVGRGRSPRLARGRRRLVKHGQTKVGVDHRQGQSRPR